jgi:mannose-1-phosphate guanylyltransferase / mannose-6-phosphate isomerase
MTLERVGLDQNFSAPIVVCNNDHRFLVREELARAKLEPQAIMLEPVARNTAAAVAVAALFADRRDADAVLLVMPSDHVVADNEGFLEGVKRAAPIAASEANTGYGYIRQGGALNGAGGGFAVEAFCEKPDREKAEAYLAQGGYFWNSGIFVLSARAYLAELERLAPSIYAAARDALDKATRDMEFLRLEPAAFAASPNVSIDYAVMEKTKAAAMLPLDVGWSDVGSWSSLWEVSSRDGQGNAVEGDAVLTRRTASCAVSARSSPPSASTIS